MELIPDQGVINGLCADCKQICDIGIQIMPVIKNGNSTVVVIVTEEHECSS